MSDVGSAQIIFFNMVDSQLSIPVDNLIANNLIVCNLIVYNLKSFTCDFGLCF